VRTRHRFSIGPAILFLAVTLLGAPGSANIFLDIDGAVQGHIDGDATQEGEENNIMAETVSHEIYVLYDQVTGEPTGERQHMPVLATKTFDRSTVPLTQANTTIEPLQVVIHFYYYTPEPQLYYAIVLSDAFMVDFGQQAYDGNPPTENLAFVYQTIMWIDVLHGIENMAQWQGSSAFAEPSGSGHERGLALAPPSPNPTQSHTMLRFDLPNTSPIELSIFDIGGRRIRELFSATTPKSHLEVPWDGRDSRGRAVANGVYIVRLKWPEGSETRRLTIAR
jgi:type VI secretion system Hcp family effector